MKSRMTMLMLGCLLMLAAGAAAVQAADYTLGAGVAVVPDYIGSDNYTVAPVPVFKMDFDNHMNVHIFGGRIQSNLIPHPNWKGGLVGEYIAKRDDDAVDNRQVSDLDEVDASFMLGGFLGYDYPTDNWGTWSARVEGMQDILDGNNGFLARVAAGWGTNIGKTMNLGLEGFAGFGDEDFMGSYFGVDARDARDSGLDRYNADAGIYEVGLNANYFWKFHSNFSLITFAGISQLVDDADDDSPIVDEGDETQFKGGLAISFHF